MNITSLFVIGFVLFIFACLPFKNDKLSHEFLNTVHNILFICAFVCWAIGLVWAMCV